MSKEYVINWSAETGWAVFIAVIVEIGQMAVQWNLEDVLADPWAWALTLGAGLGRVALAVVKNRVGALLGG